MDVLRVAVHSGPAEYQSDASVDAFFGASVGMAEEEADPGVRALLRAIFERNGRIVPDQYVGVSEQKKWPKLTHFSTVSVPRGAVFEEVSLRFYLCRVIDRLPG